MRREAKQGIERDKRKLIACAQLSKGKRKPGVDDKDPCSFLLFFPSAALSICNERRSR